MSRSLKFDFAGPDWRLGRSPEDEPLAPPNLDLVAEQSWRKVFSELPRPLELVVEIGFGRGEFLMDLATESPDTAHLGVEYSRKRVLKMARRLAKTEVRNIRLLEARGEDVVERLLQPNTVRRFWINFSDPWPKARHHRRRLVQPKLVAGIAESLVPGGDLEVATDHPEYAEAIHEVLSKESGLENVNAPLPYLAEVPGRRHTAYELEWRAEGRDLHFFSYRKPAGAR